MPRQSFEIHAYARSEEHIQGVRRRIGPLAMGYLQNLSTVTNHSFRQQKPGRQFGIMTGSPHRDRNSPAFHSNLEWFLAGNLIAGPSRPAMT
jgi:hypothetical protein